MPWIVGALLVVVFAYIGLCLFYYIAQERFIFMRLPSAAPFRYRFPGTFRDEWLERDDAELHALYFTTERPKGVILYFHGNTGSLKRWGRKASRFTQMGYDVLMPDPRGYGHSRGPMSEAALISDAVAWFDHLASRTPASSIVLYGRSLGGALAIPVAAQREPRMLLLETAFANLTDVARRYLPIIPYRWVLRYPFRNDETVRDVHCPVYIFHGTHDQVVPYDSALRLYAAVPSDVQRQLFTFSRGRHSDLYKYARFREVLAHILGD